jgi:hypothetical protein
MWNSPGLDFRKGHIISKQSVAEISVGRGEFLPIKGLKTEGFAPLRKKWIPPLQVVDRGRASLDNGLDPVW